jgi:hypothetical protein
MTISSKKIIFLTKHELNMNFYVFGAKEFILNLCFVKYGHNFLLISKKNHKKILKVRPELSKM